ncbi:major facilitator superfamily domain-containing protein [Penicillium sp. IBT 16267x]|nr:major facilitator superfamily domain-containing protein [Penicillium sp. IBT 16267x]
MNSLIGMVWRWQGIFLVDPILMTTAFQTHTRVIHMRQISDSKDQHAYDDMIETRGGKGEKSPGSLESSQNIIVDFDDTFLHPHAWPNSRRWSILILTVVITTLANISTTIVVPSLDVISAELHMDPISEGPMVMSSYVLTLAFGPLLVAPFSELWGRVPLMQAGNIVYMGFNLACGFATSRAQLLAFRVLAGLGSGATPVVGIGMISDMFPTEKRGQSLAVLNMAFILATPIGAIVGGFTTSSASWRWDFYSTSIASAVLILLSFFIYKESYPPVLLHRRKKQLFKANGPSSGDLKIPYDDEHPSIAALYYKTLIRPLYFLVTQPVIQLLGIYVSFAYGMTYLIFGSFPTLWEGHYHETKTIASLHFIAPGIGYFSGIMIGMFFADRIYRRLQRNSDEKKPEFRLPLLIISSTFIPGALIWYGWSAEVRAHWAIPTIAICFLMCGCTILFQCVTAYTIDTFHIYAASASGALFFVRGLCAFSFPLFGPTMYENIGFGWGNTLLGLLALAIGVPVPLILWRYGPRLRQQSIYAISS